jgi:hypothetical protein
MASRFFWGGGGRLVTSPDGDKVERCEIWESHRDLVPTVRTEVIGEVTKHQGISVIHHPPL